jgi:hypothetical protein
MAKKGECAFSIVLIDRDAIKEIVVKARGKEQASIWGSIGEITEVNFVEGVVLQIRGKLGVMDIGITKGELKRLAFKEKR